MQVPAKNILRVGGRFLGRVMQAHVRLFHAAPALAVIAMRAGRHDVCPNMLSAQVPRQDVIHRQSVIALAAILAGIIVASKYLAPRQLDARSRTMDLQLQPNDRRARQHLPYCFYVTASVQNHIGFARQEQAHRSSRGTDIDRFKIGV